jgi:hypothetical protein
VIGEARLAVLETETLPTIERSAGRCKVQLTIRGVCSERGFALSQVEVAMAVLAWNLEKVIFASFDSTKYTREGVKGCDLSR